ncbi:hypothetical protein BDV93DRAFT_239775 [Ceratobasidium sp. AG-I]|nr:hypothetical protein BDV93DRAFT_239775 [Ceratobasidium sp. AG-I]
MLMSSLMLSIRRGGFTLTQPLASTLLYCLSPLLFQTLRYEPCSYAESNYGNVLRNEEPVRVCSPADKRSFVFASSHQFELGRERNVSWTNTPCLLFLGPYSGAYSGLVSRMGPRLRQHAGLWWKTIGPEILSCCLDGHGKED